MDWDPLNGRMVEYIKGIGMMESKMDWECLLRLMGNGKLVCGNKGRGINGWIKKKLINKWIKLRKYKN